jgi:hypothetical protein
VSNIPEETPLIDLLRDIPIDYRGQWPIQWSEDGHETGHAMSPVGRLAHRAADRIAELEAALQYSESSRAISDAVTHGTGITKGGKHIPLEDFYVQHAGQEQPAVPEGFCLDLGHRQYTAKTGEVCTCPKYIRHPSCNRHEIRALLPETNPMLSVANGEQS